MTTSLTYGHGYLTDCDSITGWAETENGLPATLTTNGDVFTIEGVCDNVADEWVQYAKDITAVKFSGATYPNFLMRWKTSVSSNGLGARVHVGYEGGGGEWILGETVPEFSSDWTVTTGTLSATGQTKNIVTLSIHADDYPDTIDTGTYYVYYDFILFFKDTFTFPFVDDRDITFENRYADIQIPGRLGDITQYLGAASPTIRLSGKLDIGTDSAWGEPPLEYLYRVWQQAHSDPWNWLSTGGLTDEDRMINCKVTLRKFPIVSNKEATRTWSVELKHYSLSSGTETTWNNLQWLGV